MNLIKDIGNIMSDCGLVWDIKVLPYEIRVNIGNEDSDYGEVDKDSKFIPVVYSDEFAYVEYDQFCKNFMDDDYGITLSEISAIKRVMYYLEMHKEELNEMLEHCFPYTPVHKKNKES